eukprot:COSAG01_NODE_300_length_19226_cov_41.536519_2_plen_44_part_00
MMHDVRIETAGEAGCCLSADKQTFSWHPSNKAQAFRSASGQTG